MAEFVHLHNHSDIGSTLDGFGKLSEYVNRVVDIGQKAIGISDHGTTFGVYSLMKKAQEAGIVGIPGCEFYLAPQNPLGSKVKKSVFYGPNGQKAPQFDVSSNGAYTHMTIWAINDAGLKNLFKLSTLSNEPERFYQKPRIDFDLIAEYSDGLIAATGCPSSEISTRFLLNQDKKAYEYANRLKEVFGERLYVEIMDHSMNINLERRLLPKQLELAKKMNLPLLATNDAHYTLANESLHHEEMLCSQSGSRMSDGRFEEGGTRFAFEGNQYYLKTADEMAEIFPEEDFPGALSNTLLIAEMAQDLKLSYDPSLKPKIKIPDGYDEVSYFKHLIKVGRDARYGDADAELMREVNKRIKKEFEVINSSNFVGYMLTVHEYLNWAKEEFSLRDANDEIIASAIGAGRGCFLPGNSIFIRGGRGRINIENIKEGTSVRTHDGTLQKVEEVMKFDVTDDECVEINLSNGETIRCTSDHKIFLENVGFVEARTLKIGNVLLGAKKSHELIETNCEECGTEVKFCRKDFLERTEKKPYKKSNEILCTQCTNQILKNHPNIAAGLAKGSLRNKDSDVKEKNRKTQLKLWENNEYRAYRTEIMKAFSKTEKFRSACRERNKIRYSDINELDKLSKIGNNKLNTNYGYKNGYFNSERIGDEIYYASSYELKALNIFETNSDILYFERCKTLIEYSDENSVKRIYIPDFFLVMEDGTRKIIEIKAKWQTTEKRTKLKLASARKYFENLGYGFEVWTEKELEEKNDLIHNKIEVTGIRNFKYTGKVYDIHVENVHNYTVGGVTVHNSIGGSIIAYLLGISELDPIKYNLIFERFLSAGRGDTYRLTYDDGTTEEIVVSTEKTIETENGTEKKYIHQLTLGEKVIFEKTDDESSRGSLDAETELVDKKLDADNISKKDGKPVSEESTENTNKKIDKTSVVGEKPPKDRVNIPLPPYEPAELTDLDSVPF